jgi:hypothetical protein
MATPDRNDSDESVELAHVRREKQASKSRCGRFWPVLAARGEVSGAFQVRWSNRPTDERNDSLDFAPKRQKTAPNWQVLASLSLSATLLPLAGLPRKAETSDRVARPARWRGPCFPWTAPRRLLLPPTPHTEGKQSGDSGSMITVNQPI